MELRQLPKIIFGWSPEKELSDTAWLNGLRGLAAFLVMMSHYSDAFLSSMCDAPFGALILMDTTPTPVWYWHKGQRLWAPWRLPILRVFMADGGGQVAIFFVISGFVLTCGPLAETDFSKLYLQLGSSTLRRWSRLYLPCIIVSFLYVLRENIKQIDRGVGPFFWDIWQYFIAFTNWMNPFLSPWETVFAQMHGINLVVWTIPYEFSGSIFVFVLVLCLARIPFKRRMGMVAFITAYALHAWHWELWLFGTGMMLADYTRQTKRFSKPLKPLHTVLWTIALLIGLMIISFPSDREEYNRPGYDEITAILPVPLAWIDRFGVDRFWWGWGASIIVTSLCHLRFGRAFFELPVLQHLGKISFMLYLVHALIGHSIGRPFQSFIYSRVCEYVEDPDLGQICPLNPWLSVAIVITVWLVTLPPLLIVSHVLEVTVDRPVTRFGKVMDRLLLNGFGKKKAPEVVERDSEEESLLGSSSSEDVEMEEIKDVEHQSARPTG